MVRSGMFFYVRTCLVGQLDLVGAGLKCSTGEWVSPLLLIELLETQDTISGPPFTSHYATL